MLKEALRMSKNFSRLRKNANLRQEDLAFLLYNDESKRQRIGKIERGEIQPLFTGGIAWFVHCTKG
jgi:DNA-binding XRE family transcriptional regulator